MGKKGVGKTATISIGMPDHLPEVLDDVVVIEAYIQEWRRYHHTSGRGGMNTDARVTKTVIEEEEDEEEEEQHAKGDCGKPEGCNTPPPEAAHPEAETFLGPAAGIFSRGPLVKEAS